MNGAARRRSGASFEQETMSGGLEKENASEGQPGAASEVLLVCRVLLPGIHLRSPGNGSHGHWAVTAGVRKRHRELAYWRLRVQLPDMLGPFVRITLTRIAPRALDDDNNVAAFKGIRDGVADALGCSDNDPRLRFEYRQKRGMPKEYAVEVTIEEVRP